MSLVVILKNIQGLKCKGEKVAKIDFREVSHYSSVLEDSGDVIEVEQSFTWNLGRPVDEAEVLQLAIVSRGVLRYEKVAARYGLVLQTVVREGRILVSDSLVDLNNKPLPAVVCFEIRYNPPDGSCSSYAVSEIMEDEQQMLIDIEQNIANLERSLEQANSSSTSGKRRGSWHTPEKTSKKGFLPRGTSLSTSEKSPDTRKRSTALRSVRSLLKLGKQRPPRTRSCDSGSETRELLDRQDSSCPTSNEPSRTNSMTSLETNASDNDSQLSAKPAQEETVAKPAKRSKPKTSDTWQSALKAQDYQVCVTIIEARQLAGLNMDPVVCVQIGDQRKYTSVKESTNCPYYNEYFVFDFHMPPVMLFDKIITLSVQQSRNLLRANLTLGSFKLDIATVWAQPDHQFYHKWALLTDPDDVAGGPKGYLKCDISVIGKGDTVKIPPKSEKDEDDIEGNLLLPDGVPIERQRARFVVKVYRADGLPKMNSSIMANVKKAFTGEVKDLVDPYVQVSFAGLSGKTSVKRHSYAPVWNEQIVFTEMFPPLCQRIKIQLCDNDPVHATVIGTHFVDLKQISNDGEKGFLPTFGPAFIHFYGSIRDYSLIDEHSTLNTGLGEGISYRARLLIAIRTEITDNVEMAPSEVEVEPTVPVNETAYARNEEFFLYATIMDATMIDKKLGDKPMYFEISIGNAGNALDGHNESFKMYETGSKSGTSGEEEDLQEVLAGSWQSTTPASKPMTHDKIYYFLPYWDDKPCLHVRSIWPDYRRRMYNSNIIGKIVDKLEEGLSEVQSHLEDSTCEKLLKSTLEELSANCNRYVSISKSSVTGPGVGKTKLDKERAKLCQREVENIGILSRNLKAVVTKSSFKERLKTAHSYLQKLKFLVEDPQDSLPDVFIWVISSGRRVAYQRIPGRELIYSVVDEECGRHCAKVQTMFLKLPGKKRFGPSGWAIQTKLQIYMWLGILKHKKYFIQGLPKGYEVSHELRNVDRPRALPPTVIHYVQKHKFQLRAHMYQARSLIGSDASGLSDPFARVICGEFCKCTQVIDETLSPTWDELLLFDDILIYGTAEEIKKEPPSIVIELFDQDKVSHIVAMDITLHEGSALTGKSEYIGRAIARPHVKLASESYTPPQYPPSLEWYDVTRGASRAGELLAVFELLEYPSTKDYGFPTLPDPKDSSCGSQAPGSGQDQGPILPVPVGIRPTLSKYRIEVLFWGLRDLKRIHLLTVDKPRVDVECAGHILYSSVIANAKKNPNFNTPIKFLELELPEQELYRPPLTIRAVDCRSFGRYTLVGTHTINSIHKYMYYPLTKRAKDAQERKKSLYQLQCTALDPSKSKFQQTSLLESMTDLEANNGDTIITLGFELGCGPTKKDKTEQNLRRKQSLANDNNIGDLGALEDGDGCQDWWTKYFASVEAMIEENKELRKEKSIFQNQPNGTLPMLLDEAVTQSQLTASGDKNPGTNPTKRLFGLKSPTNAVKFVSRLSPKHTQHKYNKAALLKVYPGELEAQPEFEQFKEWLHTFELYRGKKTGDETEDESRIVGSFKGALKVYKWPLPKDLLDHTVMGFDPQYGFFQGVPSNEPIHVLVRVYIVKANDLHPCDLNGKADPYVVLQLGSKRISDKEHYVSKQLNPVFGKCFEIEATFPQDSLLTVQVLDWDLVGTDDMIGETKIDLENRFYSRHRATCGFAKKYDESGYNTWRDAMKPTQILSKLCKDGKIDGPVYSHGRVTIGRKTFSLSNEEMEYYVHTKGMEEHLALAVLHQWNAFPRIGCALVPEHVETRPLYNPEKPGIEQGKLEMWVDMFPMDMPSPGPSIDISPRKPKSYELRVIIWNTDDVVLEDDAFFTGEKMSDIYVKGWLKGPEDCQSTDIHYRSLTGEGNFNWRFIFPFDYLVAEEKIVINRKESLFSWDETECKIPARLELQVWDADHFSADDFLGAITLDLNRFPRGAKNSKLCSLGMLKTDGSVPMVNIFKQKRIKAWWPFYVKKENEDMELTGKVEAEIHLLTKEEAEKNPAGFCRNEPDPLDKPNRPDASFMWFLNPLKSIKYIVWHNYKWAILKAIIAIGLIILLLLFFYAIPGYSVKKILGA
ncbi:otoferlin-like isoform X1 [Temnothorax curvispinosus]|uniref:Otoferlin-like isoform X1 n=1 Tax=Temnothorax curvispinosus TaxID=300111 RepID=A0A6J1QH54_9HYME|nr:otoferlin-like isoform X1 [Temnothorax curvispinosus]